MSFSLKLNFNTAELDDAVQIQGQVEARFALTKDQAASLIPALTASIEAKKVELKSQMDTLAARGQILTAQFLELKANQNEAFKYNEEQIKITREQLIANVTQQQIIQGELKSAEAQEQILKDKIAQDQTQIERSKMTAGQLMTFIGSAIRMFARSTKTIDRQVGEFAGYVASLASTISSLAWSSASLAAGSGNAPLALMHMVIAMSAMAQSTQTLIDNNARSGQQSFEDDFYSGDRP